MSTIAPRIAADAWESVGFKIHQVANPDRLAILAALASGPHSSEEIERALDYHPTVVSHHLRVLRKAGFAACGWSDEFTHLVHAITASGLAAHEFASNLIGG